MGESDDPRLAVGVIAGVSNRSSGAHTGSRFPRGAPIHDRQHIADDDRGSGLTWYRGWVAEVGKMDAFADRALPPSLAGRRLDG